MFGKFFYYCFNNAVQSNLCNKIIKKYNKKTKKAKVGNNQVNEIIRNSNVNFIDDKKMYDSINYFIKTANEETKWNYDINWTEPIQFTKYKKNQFYNWHQDSFIDILESNDLNKKNRKLSCCVNLQNPKKYEGGQLEFKILTEKGELIINPKEFNDNQGSIIVFPSYIFHRVTPILKGTRYSLVAWSCGPNFK
jgi:PKHD-type hydroxylase